MTKKNLQNKLNSLFGNGINESTCVICEKCKSTVQIVKYENVYYIKDSDIENKTNVWSESTLTSLPNGTEELKCNQFNHGLGGETELAMPIRTEILTGDDDDEEIIMGGPTI